MRLFLLAALWLHLASSVLLVGAFFMLLLAGAPDASTARRWDERIVAWSRLLVPVAIGAGIVWLLLRTAVFENRLPAALEPRAVYHAVLETRAGLVWLARHGLLVVLAAFLAMRTDVAETRNRIAARGEAFVLAALALVLMSGSSHAAAITPGTALAVALDATHLLGTGVWVGALVPLALLLRAASADAGADARPYAVRAARRFSRAALIAVVLLMASGVMNALVQIESIAALVGTPHGRLLLAKLAILVPILGLALVNRTRVLPALSASPGRPTMRRLAAFVGAEATLALAVLALAVAMTLTTPGRHAPPVWPLPFRLSLDILTDVPTARWRALLGTQLAVAGLAVLIASLFVRRWRVPVCVAALALVAAGAGVSLLPLVVDAYPTTYRRPASTYHVTSIASGMAVYRDHCGACHGARGAGSRASAPRPLTAPPTTRRHAGELFWLVTHGMPERGMPGFAGRLSDAQRWDVINFIRAVGAAEGASTVGPEVELERAWLVAPDVAVSVGPLALGGLRDYRGRRMVLLVLYTLPGSRARMTELARMYDVLSVTGVEVIAVPTHGAAGALSELGGSPPVLFPVVTDGEGDIVETYGLFASGPHAEFLIDRQGYIRAIWREDARGVQAQVEKLNEEREVPPFPDDHVH
jgi:putative copper export protein/mono/diheme cytochrome c family protein/peroxiredoxin